MSTAHSQAGETAKFGRQLLIAELKRRGATPVKEVRDGRRTIVVATVPGGGTLRLIVKTRRRGSWHARAQDGAQTSERTGETRFWVFVDLESGAQTPSFFIVPHWWMSNDIFVVHKVFLDSHGGERPRTPGSDHHGIKPARIDGWHDRWDLLGLGPNG
jgi:hypothetical protein